MKNTIVAIFGALLIICAGCTATNTLAKGVSQKSISASGTFLYNRTGLDKETQTPEMSNLFIWGDYNSVTPGDEIFRFEESEDASIFNSASKTKKKKIFFATGDKKRMDAVIKTISEGKNKNVKTDERRSAPTPEAGDREASGAQLDDKLIEKNSQSRY